MSRAGGREQIERNVLVTDEAPQRAQLLVTLRILALATEERERRAIEMQDIRIECRDLGCTPERLQELGAIRNLIRQRRDREVDTHPSISFPLPVEREAVAVLVDE